MNDKKQKLIFYIGIPAALLLIALLFFVFYIKTDGFSGLSVSIILFMASVFLFAFLASTCFAAWVYQDCRKRSDDGILWTIIVFVATPFIGLLVYLLRRPDEKRNCAACGHRISLTANYCENCGSHIEQEEEIIMKKQQTHHLYLIIAGVICMILTVTCLTGFIVSAATTGNINTSVTSDETIWNTGSIFMNYNIHIDGVWKTNILRASDGFVTQEDLKIEDAESELLYADITCSTVPDSSSLVLWLVQGDNAKSIDVTDLSEPLEYSLNEFENGKIHVRLQINGVENIATEIYIK